MTPLTALDPVWLGLWCFGLTLVSAVVPWVNAEVIVLALPTVAKSPTSLLVFLLIATAGQMTGKCFVYLAGRRGSRVSPRFESTVAKWRGKMEGHPSKSTALVLVSSITGIPPFYVVTLLAGALRMDFGRFLAAGTIGRLIRFGAVVSVPQLLLTLIHHAGMH